MQDSNSGGPWRQPGHPGRDHTDGEEKITKAFVRIIKFVLKLLASPVK